MIKKNSKKFPAIEKSLSFRSLILLSRYASLAKRRSEWKEKRFWEKQFQKLVGALNTNEEYEEPIRILEEQAGTKVDRIIDISGTEYLDEAKEGVYRRYLLYVNDKIKSYEDINPRSQCIMHLCYSRELIEECLEYLPNLFLKEFPSKEYEVSKLKLKEDYNLDKYEEASSIYFSIYEDLEKNIKSFLVASAHLITIITIIEEFSENLNFIKPINLWANTCSDLFTEYVFLITLIQESMEAKGVFLNTCIENERYIKPNKNLNNKILMAETYYAKNKEIYSELLEKSKIIESQVVGS